MIPRFVPWGEHAPPGALAIDGAVTGSAATYSHWQGDHTTPAELAADTSTGMLVRAAHEPERWLGQFSIVCNNHIDADGLLSLLAACRPDLAQTHAARLIAAATAGDFALWTGDLAFDLLLRVHQLIHTVQASGPGWEQRCLEATLTHAEALLCAAWPAEAERTLARAQTAAAIAHWQRHPPEVNGALASVRWQRTHGRADSYNTVYQPDDLPLLALSTVIPPTCFQLLLEESEDGLRVSLDAPRHSWARTVDLPTVAWPDVQPLAEQLCRADPSVDWLTRPAAQALGFTCLLGSARDARPAGCRLKPEALIAACAAVVS